MILRALALALLGCTAALAAPLGADASAGTLRFEAEQAGATFSGGFKRFRVRLDFDPAAPEAGLLEVIVDAASIDTQDPERDEVLRGPDFFAVDRYPEARYRAARFERAGSGWRALGELSIRGVTRPVPVTFTLAPDGSATVIEGRASLRRLEFGLGQGDWAATDWVGDTVDVRFELALTPVG